MFIRSIPYNLYGWFALILAGLIAFHIVPNFGPMKKAEDRAKNEGKVLRDGAVPLTGEEMDMIKPIEGKKTSLIVFLFMPILLIIGIALGTFFILGSTKILEAFLAAVIYMAVAMSIGKYFESVKDAMAVSSNGIKAVLPAILILAMAYCINSVSKSLGAQQFIISITKSWMTAGWLPVIVFVTGGLISFFTGTSWGTYAIVTPFAMPVAMELSGGDVTTIVLVTVGAVVGGGLLGDHCSPVSDTTCLSSFGAGSDHMDHVTTQMPYALAAGSLALVLFFIIGTLSV